MTGKLLIAKPYLGDPNFERSVVLICEHSEDGAFGLVLNQNTRHVLSDFFRDIQADIPVGVGGPVEAHTLHFLHTGKVMVEGSVPLIDGLYWSGNFEQIKTLVNTGVLTASDIRFFIGYSGWGAGQLEAELKEDVWVPADTRADTVFQSDTAQIWRSVLRNLGGDYIMMANSPVDPQLN